MKDAAAKIQMLKGSMRCFVYGLLGLIPLWGLPFAIAALQDFRKGSRPGKTILECGEALPDFGWCAAAGTMVVVFRPVLVISRGHQRGSGGGFWRRRGRSHFHAFGSFSSTISQRTW